MKFQQKLLAGLLAASSVIPLASLVSLALPPTQAQAQSEQYQRSHEPQIEGFSVDEVRRLTPGVELNFEIRGTPGGVATLHIAGASHNLRLDETEPGRYEGTYTISGRDKIGARSPVTANLRVGNAVVSEVLNESLQIGVGYHANATMSGPQPKIDRFNVQPIPDLSSGNELAFTVFGTPDGKVDLAIDGVRGKVLLPEVRPGEYSGVYTIRNRDRIAANSGVVATLRHGERMTSATLGRALHSANAPVRVSQYCHHCGTIEAINMVEVRGDGSYLGTIGGGIVGALLGSQIGSGNGRTAAEVAGAVGGAVVGNNMGDRMRRNYHYEVLVRMENGGSQTITYTGEPGFRIGEKVKVNNGAISRNQ